MCNNGYRLGAHNIAESVPSGLRIIHLRNTVGVHDNHQPESNYQDSKQQLTSAIMLMELLENQQCIGTVHVGEAKPIYILATMQIKRRFLVETW